jgi:hypothetical protein
MNYVLSIMLLGWLTFFPQQDKQSPCSMHDMHGHAAKNQDTAAGAPAQSAEQRHHAFLDEERAAIGRGEGFGMAFAADHNGYPGPRHILDLQTELKLTPDQTAAVQELFDEMKQQTLARGQEVLQAEDELERRFRDNRPEAELREQVLRVASLRGELRWVHLRGHLSAAKLLTKDQIAIYAHLRHGGHHGAGAQ